MNNLKLFMIMTMLRATILAVGSLVFSASADQSSSVRELLLARNAEFNEELIRVSEHVYTVVGVGTGPVSMIVGDEGLVIVDTNIDLAAGKKILAEFRKITHKPTKAIIFTHGHVDHTGGAEAFLQEGTQIWARENFGAEDVPLEQAGVTITRQRGIRHGGILLPRDDIVHLGVGRRYIPSSLGNDTNLAAAGPIKPTHTFSGDQQTIHVADLTLKLVAANGETKDQLYVWYEADRVVFSGDNFYKSWPNLYPIRGTGYRDVYAWIHSLSAMLNENPHHLVGGHTRPVIGEANVRKTLGNYRDAIKYVFEKTIEGMNKGLTPNALVEYARLPEEYRQLDYLLPYYGHPDWGVRSIFNGLVGWFDGNPTNLFPLTPNEEAMQVAELAGGEKSLRRSFEQAVENKQYQWALQLSDYLLALSPGDRVIMLAKADVLDILAEGRLNGTARSYYRTYAMELRQAVK
ncbi:MAG: alkyl/aryl-sulfatase [Chloroflexota bacterium]|nr:alkyl/aryl-sulfatase [Chloroflexota bacterium]